MKRAYVVRCEPPTGQRYRRCGSGQVLLRMSMRKAKDAALTHALRKGCCTKVYPVRLASLFTATAAKAVGFRPPAPRDMSYYPWPVD